MLHPALLMTAVAAGAVAAVALALLLRSRRRRAVVLVSAGTLVLSLAAAFVIGVPGIRGAVADASARTPAPTATARTVHRQAVALPAWRPATKDSGPGYPRITRLQIPAFPAALRSTDLRPVATLPTHGEIGSVVIPATRSHFVARPAIVYLPPAARVAQPRLLPVVVLFSGQSRGAGPRDLVWSAGLEHMMDAIAAKHDGVAPIVVVPDQLGPATGNPMCVDSKALGNVATYIMSDVRDWILTHLPVESDRRDWTVAGFSEGGTCSIQFAAAHPDVFGSFVDVSGELAPANGSLQHTIDVGFGGSYSAYLRATPYHLLATHHYTDEVAYFAAGALDKHYGDVTPQMAAHAKAAGMDTHVVLVPGLAHNWRTGAAGLAWGLGDLAGRWGL